MLSINRDAEEEAVLRRERDEADERGYPQGSAITAALAEWRAQDPWRSARGWTLTERHNYYACIFNAIRPAWNYGRIYLNANEMRRSESNPPSYTTWQAHVEEDAMRVAVE